MTTYATTTSADAAPQVAVSLYERLAEVWTHLEEQLDEVPVLRRLADGTVTIDDYRRLLFNLRQQVVDGSPWISRAAASFDIAHFELRSAAIRHAEEEHRDYLMIERDYVAVGGSLDELRAGRKNIGSEALSGYMFHYAAQPNPVGLLGAMFIIEGLGAQRAAGWAARFQEVLGLADSQVHFMRYHQQADAEHTGALEAILSSGMIDDAAADDIVRCAEVVARLYVMQLTELDS
ncbi:iron-containing redox enzyme family protein [Microbacterium sp. M3]|uniref:Iron-containing redox enzyme family protein n=1 Tax=Microbacterium arthrosphaerae TaxID=792652 RepID=A0ABU4H2V7_9MICO|nr:MULTISPECIES: iron-containing redox enzyme family protein [Microbacterium]MDW4573676.1 iron-containing redox enzyme family protein [Microbacterium arthrosphaerae]MDW7607531.1 iron-containing redox enzyme family protein [Microbacterium sp. M3]